ncbi:hypothetical protein QUF54_02150, partial [Candidatus Marithioploca araucensis]|nr:hypothetical protein [Candidatus Marithioploca araucensis]
LLGGNPIVAVEANEAASLITTTEIVKKGKPAKPPKADKPEKTPKADKPEKHPKKDKKGKKGKKEKKANKKLIKLGINPDDIPNFSREDVEALTEKQIAAFTEHHFAALPAEAIEWLTPQQLKKAKKKALKGLNKAHIVEMPPMLFIGFTAEILGGLDEEVIQIVTEEQLVEIPDETAEALPEEDAADVLANLNTDMLIGVELEGDTSKKAKKIKKFLPPGWLIGKGNMLKRPAMAIIALPILVLPEHSTASWKMRSVVDLRAGFGIGGSTGEGDNTALEDINELVDDAGFSVEQNPDDGILEVTNELTDLELVFMPDPDGMQQAPEGTPPGIGFNDKEQYVLTLKDGEQLPINPAPANPEELVEILPEGSEVEVGENAETRITIVEEETTSEEEELTQIIMGAFSPMLNPPTEDADVEPGIHIEGEPGVDEQMTVVYEDGSSQDVTPTIQSPEEFEEVASDFEGVQDVTLKVDGSINVTLESQVDVELIPVFEVNPYEEDESTAEDDTTVTDDSATEEEADATIEFNPDGTLTFVNEDGDAQDVHIGEIKPVVPADTE